MQENCSSKEGKNRERRTQKKINKQNNGKKEEEKMKNLKANDKEKRKQKLIPFVL